MSFSYKEYSRHDACSLPTPQDRLKADISDLRHRCNSVAAVGPCYAIVCSLAIVFFIVNKAREEKQRLEREIMEERIGYIAAAHFSEEIQGKEQLFLDIG